MDDEKEPSVETGTLANASTRLAHDDKKMDSPASNEYAKRPILKSLAVFRNADDSRELRDVSTGTATFKIGTEVKKSFLRHHEHLVSVKSISRDASATAKINAKTGEVQISAGKSTASQHLQKHGSAYVFFAGSHQLQWEPSSMGVDLGQMKLLAAKTSQSLAVWKTDMSKPGQSAVIEFFESNLVGPEMELLSLVAVFAIQEAASIAGNRDDDHGGGNKKFGGVDPGNSMDMGAGMM